MGKIESTSPLSFVFEVVQRISSGSKVHLRNTSETVDLPHFYPIIHVFVENIVQPTKDRTIPDPFSSPYPPGSPYTHSPPTSMPTPSQTHSRRTSIKQTPPLPPPRPHRSQPLLPKRRRHFLLRSLVWRRSKQRTALISMVLRQARHRGCAKLHIHIFVRPQAEGWKTPSRHPHGWRLEYRGAQTRPGLPSCWT